MSEFFSGSGDSFWPHAVLLTASIAAGFAVAIGIVLENPKWSLANILVVGGVAIEAVCTLLLFKFDEGISSAQQSKIIALEQQIAYRTVDKEKFLAAISGKPKARAEIQYVKWDQESFAFAMQISTALTAAGWTLPSHPKPTDAIGWPRAPGDALVLANPSEQSFGEPEPSSNIAVLVPPFLRR